jgi:epoxyqueuosine reductase
MNDPQDRPQPDGASPPADDADLYVVLSKSERRRRAKLALDPSRRETPGETRARRTRLVTQLALEHGFSRVGVAEATALDDDRVQLEQWLLSGRQASMVWLADDVEKRCDPRSLVPGARSVLALAVDYDSAAPRTREVDLAGEGRGWISRYAWGDDYHVVLTRQLKALTDAVVRALRPELPKFKGVRDFRWYVDHGPVLERAWAVRAGLGWRGKHGLVVHPQHGSYFFLAAVVTTLELEPEPSAVTDHCGTCSACLDACPTGALVAPYQLDARRCISHTTIETEGLIPAAERGLVGDMVFGCDLCQDVCPWNRFSQPSGRDEFLPRPGLLAPKLSDLEAMTPETFAEAFRQSPVKRRGLAGVVDNVAAVRALRR